MIIRVTDYQKDQFEVTCRGNRRIGDRGLCCRSDRGSIFKGLSGGPNGWNTDARLALLTETRCQHAGWLHDFEFPLRGRRIVAGRVRAFTGTRIMLSRQATINCLECRNRNIHLFPAPSTIFPHAGSHVSTFSSVSSPF